MSADEIDPVTIQVDKAPADTWCMTTGEQHPAHVKVTVRDSTWLWCVRDWKSARSVFMDRGHQIAYGKGVAEHIVLMSAPV
jgi:hypothetical protein